MSKQRPDPDKLSNELAGASAFFRPIPATPPLDPQPSVPTEPPSLSPAHQLSTSRKAQTPTRTSRTPDRPVRRQMIRHAFELYLDQLDSLRNLADAQRRRGEPASMSRMVREAIDRYLDEQSPTL